MPSKYKIPAPCAVMDLSMVVIINIVSYMVGTVPEIQWFRTTRNRVPGFDHVMFSFAENHSVYLVRTVGFGVSTWVWVSRASNLSVEGFYFLLPHYFEDPSKLCCWSGQVARRLNAAHHNGYIPPMHNPQGLWCRCGGWRRSRGIMIRPISKYCMMPKFPDWIASTSMHVWVIYGCADSSSVGITGDVINW